MTTIDPPKPLTRRKQVRITSEVYCLTHGGVHENSLDPFGEGQKTCFNGEQGITKDDVHRTLSVTLKPGDYPSDPEDM